MRARLVATAATIILAIASASARGSSVDHPCQARLPRGPAVPAPVVFTSTCGMFRLETGGNVLRLPRHWLASHGAGTGRRFGAHLQLRTSRTGRITLRLRKRVVWRSSDSHRNTVTSVAFGPGRFAFSVYRRGVYLTNLRSAERLVVRSRDAYPFDFTQAGRLIVVAGRAIVVVSRTGRIARRIGFDPARGLAFDPRSDTLSFVSQSNELAELEGTRIQRVASVAGIRGSFAFANTDLLTWTAKDELTVTTRDARVMASARWPANLGAPDLGISPSADGVLFALRVSNASPGKRNAKSHVLLLRRGDHEAREIFSHRYAQVGCGLLGSLSWHGHELLYDSGQGAPLIFDADAGRRVLSLTQLARHLPHQGAHDLPTAAWASDYR